MDITTKFEDFNKKRVDKFEKTKRFEPLSNDIIALQKMDDGNYQPIKGSVEIEKIVDIIKDEQKIAKLESAAITGYPLNTDIQTKNIKRGDIIWMTAMLKKDSTASLYTNQYVAVKCRILDIFQNLSVLKNIIK